MGSLGRLVPWASWDEWRQVGNWLLSPDSKNVQKGIDRVAAWRARGRLPLGVDITACLVETRARDPLARTASPQPPQPQPPLPDSQLQLQYAMALVRMVNGIADSSQKGRVAASVASLAAAAGLPRILVDLRHESTHNELPSAASLRLAAEQALAWLTLNYWQRQAEHLGACMAKVGELVQEYVSLHAAAAAKVAFQSEEQQQDDDEEALASQARSSAAAAAAAVASGRRRSSARVPAAVGSGAAGAWSAAAGAGSPTRDGTGAAAAAAAAAAAGGYSAAEGQRRRKALLSELKMGVPKPAAGLLMGAVLNAGASAATLAAAGGDAAALERALATALPHLLKDWPQLPGMLLKEAVERLAACGAATAGTACGAAGTAGPLSGPAQALEQQQQQLGQEAEEAASHESSDSPAPLPVGAYLAWVMRLLPQPTAAAVKQAAGAGAGARVPGGLVPGWAPPVPLLQQLLAGSLGALASCAHRAALDWVAGDGTDGSRGSESPAVVLAALQSALRALLDCWRSAGSGSAMLAKCSALVAAAGQVPGQAGARRETVGGAQRQQQQQQQAAVAQGGDSGDALEKLVLQLQESSKQLRELRAQKKRSAEEGRGSRGAGKRWRRAAGWAPCALGNLPSRDDPNGRLAPRDEPLPEPSAEEGAALAGGAEGSPEQVSAEAPVEPAGAAAAAAEQGAQGGVAAAAPALDAAAVLDVGLGIVWPLDDGRQAWGAAELGGAGLGSDAWSAPAQPVCVPPLELLL